MPPPGGKLSLVDTLECALLWDLLDEPHIAGRRLSVLQIRDRVKELGADPDTVAEEFDLSVADVHHALADYYDHLDEMEAPEWRILLDETVSRRVEAELDSRGCDVEHVVDALGAGVDDLPDDGLLRLQEYTLLNSRSRRISSSTPYSRMPRPIAVGR